MVADACRSKGLSPAACRIGSRGVIRLPHAHQAKALVMDLSRRVKVDTYWDAFSVGSSGTPRPGSA